MNSKKKLGKTNQFTKPAPGAGQAAFVYTVKAPAPVLSLGGVLIYSPRCCTWDWIECSSASHRGARELVFVCMCESVQFGWVFYYKGF